ncbi:TIGR02611 family protein [Spirilliplanes yamanashiensis]|uniref:TIGR02611 family protein n=1 Tax=Spirilliplanes yamanashiensis TaxID=42233 RepID=A0A8J3YCR6_9ACTN|nr:uncharacterized protein (TIGR02611 family) [Spirilliplanes yamanashiensis]GIJ05585.1 hypothetical protein Sya03_49370 [Spirilliplanes yamanashiensis]
MSAPVPPTADGSPEGDTTAPAGHAGHHHGHGPMARLHRLLDPIRANPTGRLALKITVGILGGLIVAVGIALIPLPGPGWAIVILGLAVWALEFHWAHRLLEFTRRHVRSWTTWVTRQSLGLRFVIGLVGFVFISFVVWASVKMSLGVDLWDVAMKFLGTR